MSVDGVRYWLWRTVDEHGFVLDIVLQRHHVTEAAKTFLSGFLVNTTFQRASIPTSSTATEP